MKTIYKYPVPIADEPTIELPLSCTVLHFAAQNGEPFIWCLVEADEPRTIKRRFRLAGTGHPIEDRDEGRYIGTVHLRGGALVLHLFEVT